MSVNGRQTRRIPPPHLDLRTLQGRRRRALRLDLAARLGREASPVEQSQLDQLVNVYLQLEAPDIAYQPALQLALSARAAALEAALGLGAGLTSEPRTAVASPLVVEEAGA